MLMEQRFSQLSKRSVPSSDQVHARRSGFIPQHRYQHPLAFQLGMSRRNHGSQHRQYRGRNPRSSYDTFMLEMLRLHNYYRAAHCAPPLTISQRLNAIAQSYAEYLAATSTFEHSGNKLGNEKLGENLYMEWISHGGVKTSAYAAIRSWYDEIAMHDFERPKFSHETGHFTQLVWRSSQKLGVGIAYSPDRREVYIVTNYYPAGNIANRGYFEENVLPPYC